LPRQREIVLDWARIARIVKWPIVATLIILAVVFVPALWGWNFHCTATGNGSWSMANEGGVMPMSAYYTAKRAAYSVGDIVSFEYRNGATAQDNGPSIKRVTSVHPDGSYAVAGLNELCSVPPCNVPSTDIRGRIIAGPVSLMPTAYWRWLSMGWTLDVDEIALRSERIFSVETLRNAFTEGGRWRNGTMLSTPPHDVCYITGGAFVSVWDRVALESRVYMLPSQEVVYVSKLKASGWEDENTLTFDGDIIPPRTVPGGLIVKGRKLMEAGSEVLLPPLLPRL
jgi:hypothetical protein